uniref:ABC transporter domain-containing protein n=1 Tax=Plectus sambesii TaxID=2011161 RepID=A0A914UNA3_9BILA
MAALYNACRLPITLFLPFAIQFIFEGKVSLNRVQKFLELEDFSSNVEAIENGNTNGASKEPNKTTADYTDDGPIVELRNFSAKWDGSAEDGDVEQGATIQNLNLTARPGQLIAIIGPVGSGKSTLLASILGETRKVAGKLIRRGTVAYAAQEAWIFSASIRQNILFGLPHDSNTYNKTVHVCALRKDFERSADGDQALVGDRGVALSGGQKARVNLARAVYRDADIYLLDDPLSAVDAAVGRYLFDKCITDHLRKKITILVTHQLQYLQRADRILLMKGGKVVAEGTYPELMALGHTFTDILNETEQSYSRQLSTDSAGRSGSPKKILHEMEREANSDDDSEEDRLLSTANDSQLERSGASSAAILSQSLSESAWSLAMGKGETVITPEEEDRLGGSVSWSVYGHYLAAMANPLCCVFWLFGYFILVQAVYNFSDWWLNLWTDAAERERYLKKNVSAASNETLKDQEPIFKNVSLDDYMWVYIWM